MIETWFGMFGPGYRAFRGEKMKKVLTAVYLFAALLLAGCGVLGPNWYLGPYDQTDIVPTVARYEFRTTKQINDAAHPVFVFEVLKGSDPSKPILRFSSDGHRYDDIKIVRGAFYHKWGEIGGTHSPTDAYAISGHFTAPDKANGSIKLAYDGKVTASSFFTATAVIDNP